MGCFNIFTASISINLTQTSRNQDVVKTDGFKQNHLFVIAFFCYCLYPPLSHLSL